MLPTNQYIVCGLCRQLCSRQATPPLTAPARTWLGGPSKGAVRPLVDQLAVKLLGTAAICPSHDIHVAGWPWCNHCQTQFLMKDMLEHYRTCWQRTLAVLQATHNWGGSMCHGCNLCTPAVCVWTKLIKDVVCQLDNPGSLVARELCSRSKQLPLLFRSFLRNWFRPAVRSDRSAVGSTMCLAGAISKVTSSGPPWCLTILSGRKVTGPLLLSHFRECTLGILMDVLSGTEQWHGPVYE